MISFQFITIYMYAFYKFPLSQHYSGGHENAYAKNQLPIVSTYITILYCTCVHVYLRLDVTYNKHTIYLFYTVKAPLKDLPFYV